LSRPNDKLDAQITFADEKILPGENMIHNETNKGRNLMSDSGSSVDIRPLLDDMRAFLQTMYVLRSDLKLQPKKEHVLTCVNFADLQEMRPEFVTKLTASVVRYVFGRVGGARLKEKFAQTGMDESDAWSHVQQKASETFRPSSVQGQFAELILLTYFKRTLRRLPLFAKW
jgi:hypothetical protein